MRTQGMAVACAVALSCATGSGGPQSGGGPRGSPYPSPDGLLDPHAQAAALGRGVNFGNLLDAPSEGDWGWSRGKVIEESDFDLARAAGFATVRIPVRFSAHAAPTAPYAIDPVFMARVDEVVGWGLQRGLRIVVDLHHYEELDRDPQANRARFVGLWKQIARHFRDAPDQLYLELKNEPSGALGSVWNDVQDEALRAVRSIDPHHTVIVSGAQWSDPAGLAKLELPAEETNAIVTFHYYNPTLFCYQGKASFMGPDWATTGITWPGPPAARVVPAPGLSAWAATWIDAYDTRPPETNPGGEALVRNEIAAAAAWGAAHRRPLWAGEFAAQDGAPLRSRARWIAFVRAQLDAQGIPWAFWTLDSDPGTRLYDAGSGRWELDLTKALGLEVSNP